MPREPAGSEACPTGLPLTVREQVHESGKGGNEVSPEREEILGTRHELVGRQNEERKKVLRKDSATSVIESGTQTA